MASQKSRTFCHIFAIRRPMTSRGRDVSICTRWLWLCVDKSAYYKVHAPAIFEFITHTEHCTLSNQRSASTRLMEVVIIDSWLVTNLFGLVGSSSVVQVVINVKLADSSYLNTRVGSLRPHRTLRTNSSSENFNHIRMVLFCYQYNLVYHPFYSPVIIIWAFSPY